MSPLGWADLRKLKKGTNWNCHGGDSAEKLICAHTHPPLMSRILTPYHLHTAQFKIAIAYLNQCCYTTESATAEVPPSYRECQSQLQICCLGKSKCSEHHQTAVKQTSRDLNITILKSWNIVTGALLSHIIVSFTFDLILCFFLLQEYPSRLSSSDTTVKLPLPHLVAHFVQKKNLKNFCLKKLKIICIKLFSLQSLDNECPPSFRVPSFLIVINESENVSERKRKWKKRKWKWEQMQRYFQEFVRSTKM